MLWNAETFVRTLFSPVSEETFFAKHADKSFLHVPGGSKKLDPLFLGPLQIEEVADALEGIAARQLQVGEELTPNLTWYGTRGATIPGRNQKSVTLSASNAALALRQRYPGTMTIAGLSNFDLRLKTIAAAWAQGMHCFQSSDPELFFFYHGRRGLGVQPHLDVYDAYQVQLDGHKKWRVSAEPVVRKPRQSAYTSPEGNTFLFEEEIIGEQQYLLNESGEPLRHEDVDWVEFEASPGDFVYIPAGTLHATESLSDASLGVSLFVSVASRRDIFEHLLERVVSDDPVFWNQAPVARLANSPETSIDLFREAVVTGVGKLLESVESTSREHFFKFAATQPAPNLDISPPSQHTVEPQTLLRKVFFRSSLDVQNGVLQLYTTDLDLAFDEARMSDFAHSLHVTHGTFRAADACDWSSSSYAWEEVQPLLQSLVDAELLCVVAPE